MGFPYEDCSVRERERVCVGFFLSLRELVTAVNGRVDLYVYVIEKQSAVLVLKRSFIPFLSCILEG